MSKTFYKVLSAILALILIAATVCTIVFWQLGNIQFYSIADDYDEVIDEDTDSIDEGTDGGLYIDESESSGVIALSMMKLSVDEYEDYGIDLLSTDSAYVITVTPDPITATDTYSWSCTNTSQISLDVSADTMSCTVTCSGAFSSQATITVVSDADNDVSASCAIDYVKRVSSVAVSLSPSSVTFSDTATTYTVSVTPTYGTGTLTPTVTVDSFTISYDYSGWFNSSGSYKYTNSSGNFRTHIYNLSVTTSGNSVSISTPASFFYSSSSTTNNNIGSVAVTRDNVNNAFNADFANNVTSLTISVNYTASYTSSSATGYFSESGTGSGTVSCDASGVVITASSLDLDLTSIFF